MLVRQRDGDPFSGVVMVIRRAGADTGILLRAQLTRVGVEMWFKIYSPTVTGIEIVQRTRKRKRRARLFYLRYVFKILQTTLWHRRLTCFQETETRRWICGRCRSSIPQAESCTGDYNREKRSASRRATKGSKEGEEMNRSMIWHLKAFVVMVMVSPLDVHHGQTNGEIVISIHTQSAYKMYCSNTSFYLLHPVSFFSTLLPYSLSL